ncbi:MAG: ROK family protein [Rhodothermaceae bacterium]|nr:ROK family protein [Rhodothermaceae bacterium]MYH12955.1 ROK family protein [Rhodothermaceae bacterium]MYJ51013.1 ROK family protein [Rhodothermaceae bacterium]
MNEYVIGVDVGGTRIKTGAVLADGTLLEKRTRSSGFAMSAEALETAVVEEISCIQTNLGGAPIGIGMGFPGAVDPAQGVVLLPGKLRLEGYPIVPNLSRNLSLPVIADNDGRLSIIAEAHYGKARGYRWAVSITLGTGVGSGAMLDGKILRDPHLQFGTQASHVVQQSSSNRLCITRARGTANILCSATALGIIARDSLARGLPSVLNERYFDDPASIDFEAVIEGVAQDDKLCMDAFSTWKTELSWFLVSVVHMYAPEIIILSGGAAAAAPYFLDEIRTHVINHTFRYPVGEEIKIELSEITAFSVVLGAAALAWEQVDLGMN